MTPSELKQARQMLGLSQRGKGLTQVELGRLIGLSSNSVARAERGIYAITEQTAQAVRLLKWIDMMRDFHGVPGIAELLELVTEG